MSFYILNQWFNRTQTPATKHNPRRRLNREHADIPAVIDLVM